LVFTFIKMNVALWNWIAIVAIAVFAPGFYIRNSLQIGSRIVIDTWYAILYSCRQYSLVPDWSAVTVIKAGNKIYLHSLWKHICVQFTLQIYENLVSSCSELQPISTRDRSRTKTVRNGNLVISFSTASHYCKFHFIYLFILFYFLFKRHEMQSSEWPCKTLGFYSVYFQIVVFWIVTTSIPI
jgi:hypothetical protein